MSLLRLDHFVRPGRQGIALVIVLAMVVLVTGLIVAFFSRALSERQMSGSSSNEAKADLFAQSASNIIIGDLQQEIAAGSTQPFPTPTPGTTTLYIAPTGATAVAYQVGTGNTAGANPLPNLVKRSAYSLPFYAGPVYDTTNYPPSNRAAGPSAQTSTTVASLNGRSVTAARWNAPLLLPKKTPSGTDMTPVTTFTAPDWVLVARDSSNPTVWSPSMVTSPTKAASVVGRYAYNIYDEGGLLDANAAGYPTAPNAYPTQATGTLPLQPTRKSLLAYADLTVPVPTQSNLLTPAQVNALVGWRNYASGQPGGAFPSYTPATTPAASNAPAPGLSPFDVLMLTSTKGFLSATNSALYHNQSDRMFASRQQLIDFLLQSVASPTSTTDVPHLQNALQYLGTFSRALNQPSLVPLQSVQSTYPGYDPTAPKMLAPASGGNNAGTGLDVALNPAFPAARALTSFTRNDGSLAMVGEPLVKKRFALNRLAWITCKGPSAPRASSGDADIVLLKQYLGGDPAASAWLAQGTDANIKQYFGLEWKIDNVTTLFNASGTQISTGDGQKKWFYDINNGGSGAITRLYDSTGSTDVAHKNRDADFFELLKATIKTGALGKTITIPASTLGTPYNAQYNADSSVDYAIIQIGANIIDQFDTDGFPTRIVFNDGSSGYKEFRGIENLPYLYRVQNGLIKVAAPTLKDGSTPYGGTDYPSDTGRIITDTGVGAFMQYPELWNPHDWNLNDLTQTQGAAGMGPTQFRTFATTDTNVALIAHTGGSPPSFSNRSDSTSVDTLASPGYNSKYGFPWAGELRGLSLNNTEMDFTITQDKNGAPLFREPTLLFRPGRPLGSNLSAPPLASPTVANLGAIAGTPALFVGGGLNSAVASTDTSSDLTTHPLLPALHAGYVGFYYGAHPLQYIMTTTTPETRYGARQTGVKGTLTVHMYVQCQDAFGNWITYDEKYQGDMGNPDDGIMKSSETGFLLPEGKFGNVSYVFDPRTSRFDLYPTFTYNSYGSWNFPPYKASLAYSDTKSGWIDQSNSVVLTDRNGSGAGTALYIRDTTQFALKAMGWYPGGWSSSATEPLFRIGSFSQNNPNITRDASPFDQAAASDGVVPSGTTVAEYYTDADGIARRAMGGWNTQGISSATVATFMASSVPGLPMATANDTTINGTVTRQSQSDSRPMILNRPFYSPAELGYVFSGTPWKNLDMLLPESGYGGLLDVFCIQDSDDLSGMVAGRVNLNTRQVPVLQAVLAGTYKDEWTVASSTLPSTTALAVAQALVNRTSLTGPAAGPKAGTLQPLTNISDLVGRWAGTTGTDGSKTYDGFSADLGAILTATSDQNVGRFREEIVRALTDSGQTRIWNLMIDLIVQTGRYPAGSTSPANFNVEGEQRYWVHVAIDRLTGKVIDKQIEVVKE
jgi:hypothetical protein